MAEHTIMKSIDIANLKGLNNCQFSFDKPLIAIMGVNGIGKSTIIHALACCFKPENERGIRNRFSAFFPKSPNAGWKNSRFKLECDTVDDDGNILRNQVIEYGKATDRWTPRYERQLKKNTYYIGVSSCCPAIELFKGSSVLFNTSERTDKISKKIIDKASYILNKDYDCLTENKNERINYLGVRTKTNLKYTSLSMGAGEQRLFVILTQLYEATAYSLVLIDEIDLLLHSEALKRLIEIISKMADEKHLQVVFTTHSLVMADLRDCVSIKYLDRVSNQIKVYNGLTTLAWKDMAGVVTKPIRIFVEDDFAKAIVRSEVRDLQMLHKVHISTFGTATNAFILAASMVIQGENIDNTLIIIDGDRYRLEEERKKMIEKYYSGSEEYADNNRQIALSIIDQFLLPENKQPEEYLHDMLVRSNKENEIVSYAKRINAVNDKHEWIDRIARDIDDSSESIMNEIIDICKQDTEWKCYVQNIRKWLEERKDI